MHNPKLGSTKTGSCTSKASALFLAPRQQFVTPHHSLHPWVHLSPRQTDAALSKTGIGETRVSQYTRHVRRCYIP
jgi:hypothetical protein